MSDALNRLIVMSGMNAPSPARSYYEGSDAKQREESNALSMQSTQQQMRIRRQQAEQAKQDRDAKIAATYMQSVLRAPEKERISAYQRAKEQLALKHGITAPETYDEQDTIQLLSYAGLPVYETRKRGDRSLTRTDIVSGQEEKILTESEGYAGVGGDAFSRNLQWLNTYGVPPNATDEEIMALGLPPQIESEAIVRANRAQNVQSGTGQTLHQQTTEGRQQTKFEYDRANELQNEYLQGRQFFGDMSRNIAAAKAALDSGDTMASQRVYTQLLGQVADSNVRAYAMFQEQNKPFGNLAQRVMSSLQRYVMGTVPDREKDEFRAVLDQLEASYAGPEQRKLRDSYRKQLKAQKVENPFAYIPPDPDYGHLEIRDAYKNKMITKDVAEQMLWLYFPEIAAQQ